MTTQMEVQKEQDSLPGDYESAVFVPPDINLLKPKKSVYKLRSPAEKRPFRIKKSSGH